MSTITPPAASKDSVKATLEDYVQVEQSTGERHEFQDGKLVKWVGGSGKHALIASNFAILVMKAARLRGCQTLLSDMRVQIAETNSIVYPDVVVTDGKPKFTTPTDTLTNPLLIVEVLSPSTEAYDRGDRFEQYCQFPSFKEYLQVSQDKVSVTQFVRQADDNWLRMSFSATTDQVKLRSLDTTIDVAEIYTQVEF